MRILNHQEGVQESFVDGRAPEGIRHSCEHFGKVLEEDETASLSSEVCLSRPNPAHAAHVVDDLCLCITSEFSIVGVHPSRILTDGQCLPKTSAFIHRGFPLLRPAARSRRETSLADSSANPRRSSTESGA